MTRESKNEQKGHEQALRIAVYEGEHMTRESKSGQKGHEAHMRCASKIKSHRPGIQKKHQPLCTAQKKSDQNLII